MFLFGVFFLFCFVFIFAWLMKKSRKGQIFCQMRENVHHGAPHNKVHNILLPCFKYSTKKWKFVYDPQWIVLHLLTISSTYYRFYLVMNLSFKKFSFVDFHFYFPVLQSWSRQGKIVQSMTFYRVTNNHLEMIRLIIENLITNLDEVT